MKARIFVSTGEVSGDMQGARLIEALYRQAAPLGLELEILALGGDRIAATGARLLGHTAAIGSIGIIEAIPFVIPTLRLHKQAQQYLQQYPPDLIVLIDYFSPNSRIGRYARQSLTGVPVVYYIAPQEWVWSFRGGNTQQVVDITDRLLAIFPEEARYYREKGAPVTYVGHPLVDQLSTAPSRDTARQQLGISPDQVAIALLPASRRQEIKQLLPIIGAAARQIQDKLPHTHFWIPLSLECFRAPIEAAIQHYGLQATIVTGQSQLAIAAADLAISKSGTANLEIALMGVPQVVLYRVNPITAWVARNVLRFSIPFMSPPNLVLMQPIVPEFLQEQATPANITQTALDLLLNPQRRQQMLDDYAKMRQAMGEPGVCDRAALEILGMLHH